MRAISAAGVEIPADVKINSAPHDHLAAAPHCRVITSAKGRAGGAGGCPTVATRVVSPAGVPIHAAGNSAPDDHFAVGPHCRMLPSASGRTGGVGGCPTVAAWIVSAAGVLIDDA